MGGISLPQILRAQDAAGESSQHKAVIMIFLAGGPPSDRPVYMQEVFATVYRNLGINVASTTIPDNNGRTQYLVDRHEPIAELS